jgi:hemolysin D
VLIELDPTVNAAERDHLQSDSRRAAQHRAVARGTRRRGRSWADFTLPADANPALIVTQRQLLLNQVTEHRAKIAALARQQAQKEPAEQANRATIHKLETTIP